MTEIKTETKTEAKAETKKRILIVDDAPDLVALLREVLETNNYHVIEATDGQHAFEIIGQSVPDLILSDVIMPRMDGFAFYKELKKDSRTTDIPIIIITARTKMVDTFSALGANDFLPKPVDSQILLDKVKTLIARSASGIKPEPAPVVEVAPVQELKPAMNWGMISVGLFLLVIVGFAILMIVSMMTTPRKSNLDLEGFAEEQPLVAPQK